jgi:hypothetical protein
MGWLAGPRLTWLLAATATQVVVGGVVVSPTPNGSEHTPWGRRAWEWP